MACKQVTSALDVEDLSEGEIVDAILCRLEELRHAGCDEPECIVVAARVDVSLDAAVDLVARGCPAGLVLPILL
ncbi:MAG: hypothetical protein ICV67_02900 [Thermoleophilia bacterium]|nr:hypothetical protein [Thermoleophilia bacterium]